MSNRIPYSRSARLQRDREILRSLSVNLQACKRALGKLSKDVREGLVEMHIDMALNSIDYELTKNQVSMASLGASGLPQGDDGIT